MIELTGDQQSAIQQCTDLSKRVVSVTGQAGTGKTYIINEACRRLTDRGRTVALAAPTGRAARRIYESTGRPATTIHKLLGYGKPEVDPNTGAPIKESGPTKHKDEPLEYTDVIVDEYAMVNEELHRNLIDALPKGGRLLAFGDVNQLPPIENWEIKTYDGLSPFERLLRLPSSVSLDVVFRQAGDSGILENARRVRNGHPPIKRADFNIVISPSPIKLLREHIAKSGIDYQLLANQIITPSRNGQLGTHTLNQAIQRFYGPTEGLFLPRHKWDAERTVYVHVGEKVICVENTYDMRDFFERFHKWKDDVTPDWDTFIPAPDDHRMLNGEIGIVQTIRDDGSIEIAFSDRVVQVPHSYRDWVPRANQMLTRDPRKCLELAYAVTTHKMQGSECDNVAFVTNRIQWANISRNNIYTAITRAKHSVTYITDQSTWQNGQKLTAHEKAKLVASRRKEK